jgi:hypothetical protein
MSARPLRGTVRVLSEDVWKVTCAFCGRGGLFEGTPAVKVQDRYEPTNLWRCACGEIMIVRKDGAFPAY